MANVDYTAGNDNTIRLHDGRTLGYAEYGHPDGFSLFYFHGHPGARSEARFLAEVATRASVRLIGIDRPGMGLSTFKAGRSILDWPDDVLELADNLRLNRFAVFGFSGGGPYALACAYKIPHRLTTCGIGSGVGHVDPLRAFLSRWLPWLMLPVVRRFFSNKEQAQKMLEQAARNWPEPDRQSLLRPAVKELMATSLVEGLRQGTRGAAYDGMLIGGAWGFKLEEIKSPAIFLWHGELDKEIPVSSVRVIAEHLGPSRATYYPEEGHISLIVNHAADIVSALT